MFERITIISQYLETQNKMFLTSLKLSIYINSYVKLNKIKYLRSTRENAIFDAIDYQIPVTQLSVLEGLKECEGDRDIKP